MTVNNKFIQNIEATPLVETNVFDEDRSRRFALVAFGTGVRENDELFSSYLKLRANVYVHQTGILSEGALRIDGTEMDEDDERSSHFLVLENKLGAAAAVACIRLIEKSAEYPAPLPIETVFPEVFRDNEPGLNSVEVSRFISRLDSAAQQLSTISELFKSGLARINQENLGPVFAIVEEELEQSLKFMGAHPRRLADPLYVHRYNSSNVGIEMNTSAMTEAFGADEIQSMDVSDGSVRYWGKAPIKTPSKEVQRIA